MKLAHAFIVSTKYMPKSPAPWVLLGLFEHAGIIETGWGVLKLSYREQMIIHSHFDLTEVWAKTTNPMPVFILDGEERQFIVDLLAPDDSADIEITSPDEYPGLLTVAPLPR